MRHAVIDEVAPATGGRAEESRRRRSAIVAAAATVLGRQGSAETSMKEIAREAGVAPGLLHYYFESKDDLLVAVVTELDRRLSDAWASSLHGMNDPLERLVAGLDAVASHCARHPETWRALSDLGLLSLSAPALVEPCRALRARLAAAIEAEVRGALGQLPAYTLVAPRDLSRAIAATIEGAATSALVEGRESSAEFRALKVMLLSLVVTAHVTAGQEPPIARLAELLRGH
jgi:AcrR family transcriptional regulator